MRTEAFALLIGVAYLSAGVLGLVPDALVPPPENAPPVRLDVLYGYLLGLFPVNILHSGVHIAIGAWGVASWHKLRLAKVYARAVAMVHAALALVGMVPALNTLFGLAPIHGNDVWLHAGTVVFAAYFGWRTEADAERRGVAPDRRQDVQPVSQERRLGHSDRRAPGSEV